MHAQCVTHCTLAGFVIQAGPVNVITWNIFRLVGQDPGVVILGSRTMGSLACHVITKLIFVVFNQHAKILANSEPVQPTEPANNITHLYFS